MVQGTGYRVNRNARQEEANSQYKKGKCYKVNRNARHATRDNKEPRAFKAAEQRHLCRKSDQIKNKVLRTETLNSFGK
jgi:hypothetical protein